MYDNIINTSSSENINIYISRAPHFEHKKCPMMNPKGKGGGLQKMVLNPMRMKRMSLEKELE